MWIGRLALSRPYTFVIMAMLITLLGGVAVETMPVDIFPAIDLPVLSVIFNYGGLSAEEMANRVVTIFERQQLAATTAARYRNLLQKGAVSKQENDNYQAQQEAQHASVGALEKAVNAARSNITAAAANVARPTELESHRQVRAPFAGVITLRSVDTGVLVRLKAKLTIPDRPNRRFEGTVTHTSDSLDAASRTLLAEIQIDNKDGQLMPGMYSQVTFETSRREPPADSPGYAGGARGRPAGGYRDAGEDGTFSADSARARLRRVAGSAFRP